MILVLSWFYRRRPPLRGEQRAFHRSVHHHYERKHKMASPITVICCGNIMCPPFPLTTCVSTYWDWLRLVATDWWRGSFHCTFKRGMRHVGVRRRQIADGTRSVKGSYCCFRWTTLDKSFDIVPTQLPSTKAICSSRKGESQLYDDCLWSCTETGNLRSIQMSL